MAGHQRKWRFFYPAHLTLEEIEALFVQEPEPGVMPLSIFTRGALINERENEILILLRKQKTKTWFKPYRNFVMLTSLEIWTTSSRKIDLCAKEYPECQKLDIRKQDIRRSVQPPPIGIQNVADSPHFVQLVESTIRYIFGNMFQQDNSSVMEEEEKSTGGGHCVICQKHYTLLDQWCCKTPEVLKIFSEYLGEKTNK